MDEQSQARRDLVRSIIMAILALSVGAVVITAQIYAWFAISGNTRGNFGADVVKDISMERYISFDELSWSSETDIVEFAEIFAGQVNQKQFFLKFINNGDNVKADIYFYAPYGDFGQEQPYYDNGYYYYLGSQLQISNIVIKVNNVAIASSAYTVGLASYLVPSAAVLPKGQATAVSAQIEDIPALLLIKGFTFESGDTVEMQFSVTFVDNGEDQSIYQNTGNFSCKRRLMLKW